MRTMAVQLEQEVRQLAPVVDALVAPARSGVPLTGEQFKRLESMVERLSFIRRMASFASYDNLLVLTEGALDLVPAGKVVPVVASKVGLS